MTLTLLVLLLLGFYFFSLVLSYTLLVTPGREKLGLSLLTLSVVLPLSASFYVLVEVERFIAWFLGLIRESGLTAYVVLFFAAWITVSTLLVKLFEPGCFFGDERICRLLAVIIGAYASLHLELFLVQAAQAFVSSAIIGTVITVILLHSFLVWLIIKAVRRSRSYTAIRG